MSLIFSIIYYLMFLLGIIGMQSKSMEPSQAFMWWKPWGESGWYVWIRIYSKLVVVMTGQHCMNQILTGFRQKAFWLKSLWRSKPSIRRTTLLWTVLTTVPMRTGSNWGYMCSIQSLKQMIDVAEDELLTQLKDRNIGSIWNNNAFSGYWYYSDFSSHYIHHFYQLSWSRSRWLEPFPPAFGWEEGSNQDWLSVNHRAETQRQITLHESPYEHVFGL